MGIEPPKKYSGTPEESLYLGGRENGEQGKYTG